MPVIKSNQDNDKTWDRQYVDITNNGWFKKDIIQRNDANTIYIFGANNQHFRNPGAGGVGQAAPTTGCTNLLPIDTMFYAYEEYEKFDRSTLLSIHDHLFTEAKKLKHLTFIFPTKKLTKEEIQKIQDHGRRSDNAESNTWVNNLKEGDEIINIGFGTCEVPDIETIYLANKFMNEISDAHNNANQLIMNNDKEKIKEQRQKWRDVLEEIKGMREQGLYANQKKPIVQKNPPKNGNQDEIKRAIEIIEDKTKWVETFIKPSDHPECPTKFIDPSTRLISGGFGDNNNTDGFGDKNKIFAFLQKTTSKDSDDINAVFIPNSRIINSVHMFLKSDDDNISQFFTELYNESKKAYEKKHGKISHAEFQKQQIFNILGKDINHLHIHVAIGDDRNNKRHKISTFNGLISEFKKNAEEHAERLEYKEAGFEQSIVMREITNKSNKLIRSMNAFASGEIEKERARDPQRPIFIEIKEGGIVEGGIEENQPRSPVISPLLGRIKRDTTTFPHNPRGNITTTVKPTTIVKPIGYTNASSHNVKTLNNIERYDNEKKLKAVLDELLSQKHFQQIANTATIMSMLREAREANGYTRKHLPSDRHDKHRKVKQMFSCEFQIESKKQDWNFTVRPGKKQKEGTRLKTVIDSVGSDTEVENILNEVLDNIEKKRAVNLQQKSSVISR